VLCSPFVPMLFQGEEWGAASPFQYFTDHGDAELGRAVSEGRRREFAAFGWAPDDVPDPQDPVTFERSKLNWDEPRRPPHDELLEWHRHLVALRREVPALATEGLGPVEVRYDEDARWLVLERGPLSVVCNLASQEQAIPVAEGTVTVPPDNVVILG
jgi:maltooligosyltrehalose trehalohydrolase